MNLIERLAPFGRLLRDQRSGFAALEFALVLPLMMALYFGTAELVQAVVADGLVAQASATVTNIVAQYTTISASTQMPDVLSASSQILAANPGVQGGIVVSCIAIDSSGKATVSWSQALNATPRTTGQVMALPANLDVPNTTLIHGEAAYALTPSVDFLSLAPFHLSSSIYMSPRNATTINLVP